MYFRNQRQKLIWRKRGTALDRENLLPTVKNGEGGVMVWGCMAANGRLTYCMSQLQPVKQMCQSQKQIFVHKDLELSTHVWVRRENGRSLESKYVGPYQVIEKNPKYFKIRIGSKEDMVSIDRLKPAYIVINNLSTVCYENACNSNIHCKSVSFITRKEVM